VIFPGPALTLALLSTLGAAAGADGGAFDAAPHRLERKVSPDKVKLGEPFTYEIVLRHGPERRYELKSAGDLGDFELLGQTRARADAATEATTTFRLTLALFALGPKTTPTFTFDVTDGERRATHAVEGGPVEGITSLPEGADAEGAELLDLKPPEDVPVPSYKWVYLALGLLAAAGLVYALVRLARRLRDRPVPAGPPPSLEERTLALLEALRAEGLPAQGRAQEFYFRLSEILRGYLGERYRFDALECTSAELMASLRRLHTPNLPYDAVAAFALESDLVKFAKAVASEEQCKKALEFSYDLVHRTTPAPTPEGHASPPVS
jgi:hypothetical protein